MNEKLTEVFARVADEIDQANYLAHQGKFKYTPAHPDCSNNDAVVMVQEEIDEVGSECISLLASYMGLQQKFGEAVRTTHDMDQLLGMMMFRKPAQVVIDRCEVIRMHARLQKELAQVAGLAILWMSRLKLETPIHD